jgi:glucoamylase
MEAFAGERGLIPEQVWNLDNRVSPTFFNSGPTGSATPLAWAHAEYIKLVRSAADGKVFDRLDVVASRYLPPAGNAPSWRRPASALEIWNLDHRPQQMKAGKRLRLPLAARFRLRWTINNWANSTDTTAASTAVGIYYVDIPTTLQQAGSTIQFTMFWLDSQTWQGGPNYSIALVP